MKRMASILGVLLLAYPALADDKDKTGAELTKGREILKKAGEAVKKVKLVSYKADYQGTKWVTQYVPAVTGTAILGEQSKWEIPSFFCKVKLQKYGSEETKEFTAGSDGDLYFVIDPSTKMAHEDMDEAVLGSENRNIQRVLMREFSQPESFAELLEAESIELKGTVKIGDEECYEVNVKTERPPELLWYFSKRDSLPRKVVRIYKNPEGEEGTTELTVFDLAVNPKLDKDPFKLVVPPGYTKTDEFAP